MYTFHIFMASVCCVKAFNPPRLLLTVLIVVVNNCQVPSLLFAPALSQSPVGLDVAFLAFEHEALVFEKHPAWGEGKENMMV